MEEESYRQREQKREALSVVASEASRSSREASGPGAREQRARSPEQERASPGRSGEDSRL